MNSAETYEGKAEAGGEGTTGFMGFLKRPWVKRVAGLVWVGILGLALWALYREFSSLSWAEFRGALGQIGPGHIALALLCTMASYLCNSSLDLFAMRAMGQKIPWWVVLRTSYVAMTFSINAGGAILGGGSVRLRTYPRFGVEPLKIGILMIFIGVVAWAGYFLNAGLQLSLSPEPVQEVGRWLDPRLAGPIFLGISATIVTLFMLWRAGLLTRWLPERWRPRSEQRDARRLLMIPAAALASGLDYFFAGLTLRCLFPEIQGIQFHTFLATFAIAQSIAAISHVPGGAGVLEIMLTKLLKGTTSDAAMASALLVFRVLFYLLPFLLAAIILGTWEYITRRRDAAKKAEEPAPTPAEK